MSEIPQSSSAVATKQRIGLAVSLYVGFAVLTAGAVGGSLAAALLMKKTVTPVNCYSYESQLYRDGGLTKQVTKPSDCTSTQPAREVAYMPTDIQNIEALNSFGIQGMASFYSGQPTSNGQTLLGGYSIYFQDGVVASTAAPLVLNVASGGIEEANVVVLQTNLGVLNVCVPKRTTPTSQYFVGSFGNTYANAALTERTTTESCPSILARAAKPSQLSGAESLERNFYAGFSRNDQAGGFGYMNYGYFSMNLSTLAIPGNNAPLHIFIRPDAYSANEFPATVNDNIIALQTNLGEFTICIPKITFPSQEEIGQLGSFFFDTVGTPYTDAHLSNRAIDSSCADILGMAYNPVGITNVRSFQIYASAGFSKNTISGSLGLMSGGYFSNSSAYPQVTNAPLRITVYPYNFSSNPDDYPVTLQENFFTIEDSNQQLKTVCIPEVTIQNLDNLSYSHYFFVGNDGTTYSDAHLRHRVLPESCPSILERGFKPTSISQVTTSLPYLPNYTISFRRGTSESYLGYYSGSYFSQYQGMVTGLETPLAAEYTNMNYQGVNITLAPHTLVLQTEPGNAQRSLCIPEVNIGFGQKKVFYIGGSGLTYSDPFMRQVVCFQDGQQ